MKKKIEDIKPTYPLQKTFLPQLLWGIDHKILPLSNYQDLCEGLQTVGKNGNMSIKLNNIKNVNNIYHC